MVATPDDLKDVNSRIENTDYYLITVPDLDPQSSIFDGIYHFIFRWQWEDGTYGKWSVAKDFQTQAITLPEVDSIVSSWANTTLKITFNRPESIIKGVSVNRADSFKITLTDSTYGTSYTFTQNVDKNNKSQTFTLTEAIAREHFRKTDNAKYLPSQYTGKIQVVNKDGISTGIVFTTAASASGLGSVTIPDGAWSTVSQLDGYTVGWDLNYVSPLGVAMLTPGQKENFDYAQVYEASTSNGTFAEIVRGQSPQIIKHVADLTKKYVKIKFVGKDGTTSAFSNYKEVKAADPSGYDATAPSNAKPITAGTPSVDSNGLFDFNYKVSFSWLAEEDTTTLGYKIRWRINGSTEPYQYMSVPGRLTTTANLFGVLAGQVYEVGKSTYDEYDNVSSTWQSTTVTVPAFSGSIKDTKYISAGDMKLGYGVGPGGEAFNKGLYLSPNNYWYIYGNTVTDNTARIKIGSSTDSVYWDGTKLTVTGEINANSGNFTGSVSVGGISKTDNTTQIPGQLRVVQKWDVTNPALPTPTIGIEIGKLSTAYVAVPGVSLSNGIYAYNKEGGKYVLINAADGSIRTNNIIASGTFSTTGYVDAGLQGTATVTTSLGNGVLSLTSSIASTFINWGSAANLKVSDPGSSVNITPVDLVFRPGADLGVAAGTFAITASPGVGRAIISWSGGFSAPAVQWLNYQSTERGTHALRDSVAARPLVITDQGYQYLGAQHYYGAASSTTMAGSSIGVDGDIYFSTNVS